MSNSETGESLATATLIWPDGVQQGLTEPVVYVPSVDGETASALSTSGYRVFATNQSLIWYLEGLVGVDIDGDQVVGDPDESGSS